MLFVKEYQKYNFSNFLWKVLGGFEKMYSLNNFDLVVPVNVFLIFSCASLIKILVTPFFTL